MLPKPPSNGGAYSKDKIRSLRGLVAVQQFRQAGDRKKSSDHFKRASVASAQSRRSGIGRSVRKRSSPQIQYSSGSVKGRSTSEMGRGGSNSKEGVAVPSAAHWIFSTSRSQAPSQVDAS